MIPRLRSLAARLAVSALSGVAILLAFPPYGLWWMAPLGTAGLALAVWRCRPVVGGLLGWVCGLALFFPLLSWTNLNTGWFPWTVLSIVEGAYLVPLGWVLAWCSPLLERRLWGLVPLVGAGWTVQEAIRSRVPFGGFPWGKLAFSQADSPLLPLAAVGGAALVSFAVAALGGAVATAGLVVWRVRREGVEAWRGSLRGAVAATVVLGAGCSGGWLVPVDLGGGGWLTVAIVQGNVPRLGLDFNAQRRAVLDNHVAATKELAASVAAGEVEQPDVVVWPENSSDIDPLVNSDASAAISAAASAIGVPILVGAVLQDGNYNLNAALVWEPGVGVTQRYVKRHPVPFAEYVPFRSLVRLVTTQVDKVRTDFLGGEEVGTLRLGEVTLGDVICFEVAYDGLVRDVVREGAGLIVVQTNNATFNVAEASQQLAMVRLRAVEHGRPALMASTVGISAFVDAEGGVVESTGYFTAETLVRRIELGTGTTVATWVGSWPEYVVSALFVVFLAVAWVRRRRGSGSAVLDAELEHPAGP